MRNHETSIVYPEYGMGHLFGVEGKRLDSQAYPRSYHPLHASFGDYGGANDGSDWHYTRYVR